MKEPRFNAVSNLAYAAAAAVILAAGPPGPLTFILAAGLVVLTVGSWLFHATGRKEHQYLDEFGMYATFVPLAAVGLAPIIPIPGIEWLLSALVFATLVAAGTQLDLFSSFHALAVLAVVILVGLVATADLGGTLLVLAVFALAFVFRYVDRPVGHGPLHAVWHLATAVGIGAAFFVLA